MHSRWHTDPSVGSLAPRSPGQRGLASTAEDFFHAPLPDLEQQLAAELSGAAWAVVAFAPEDAIWCDWLYRNLNGYPLPPSLVDRVTPHGFPRPACFSVFPDRRDPFYDAQFPRALAESVYLVVVCSPHSAGVAGLDEKIRAFKSVDGEERIIALVVDGPPEENLEERERAPQCDWLPSWLRWRLEEDGFRAADRSEPRVVDARRGYRSLRHVRDGLLTALADMDGAELERLGGCQRPVESVAVVEQTHVSSSDMSVAVAISSPISASRRGGSKYTICMAVALILVAAVFGIRSFREITADEPASTLDVGPVTGVLPGHSGKTKPGDDAYASAAPALPPAAPSATEAPAVTAPPAPVPAVAQFSAEPPAKAAELAPAPVPIPIAKSNVPQVAPAVALATSHIVQTPAPSAEPPHDAAPAAASEAVAPIPASYTASYSESDAVLLDEVHTLERRGDQFMAEKRTDDALDLLHAAAVSAEEYAARKTASPSARDHVITLDCKLAMLQNQNSSTAEARTTYQHARRILLQEKSQGPWDRMHAKLLDQIESRLLSLPRD
jgi:hypothetical protein